MLRWNQSGTKIHQIILYYIETIATGILSPAYWNIRVYNEFIKFIVYKALRIV